VVKEPIHLLGCEVIWPFSIFSFFTGHDEDEPQDFVEPSFKKNFLEVPAKGQQFDNVEDIIQHGMPTR
jgi:hypothetical protein